MINWDKLNDAIAGLNRNELIAVRDWIDFRIVKNHQEISDIVIQVCCQKYEVPITDYYSNSRKREIVMAKHMSMYIMRTFNLNTVEIGRLTGKNHATVVHGSKKIETQIDLYKDIQEDFEELLKEIQDKLLWFQKTSKKQYKKQI